MKTQEIIQSIEENLMNAGGGFFQEFGVGIRHKDDPRPLGAHPAPEGEIDCYVARECKDHQQAMEVEDYFNLKGMRGGPGGRSKEDTVVFVYRRPKGMPAYVPKQAPPA